MIPISQGAAQGVGLIAMGLDIYNATIKNDIQLKRMVALSSGVFCLHFVLLSAWAGAGSEFLTVLRSLTSIYWRRSWLMALFMLGYTGAAFATCSTLTDVFPYLASGLGTYAMFALTGVRLRLLFIIGQSLWFVYSILHGSISGSILYAVLVIGTITTIWQMRGTAISQPEG